jgi:hypothetical protein
VNMYACGSRRSWLFLVYYFDIHLPRLRKPPTSLTSAGSPVEIRINLDCKEKAAQRVTTARAVSHKYVLVAVGRVTLCE